MSKSSPDKAPERKKHSAKSETRGICTGVINSRPVSIACLRPLLFALLSVRQRSVVWTSTSNEPLLISRGAWRRSAGLLTQGRSR